METLFHVEKDLRQIVDILLLNGTLTECPGLLNGKMSISIFFFHYAKYTHNRLFSRYALRVIEEMQRQIHVDSPSGYEKGIAGIGVGIDFLIRNQFLDAEDDIFEDFDQQMVRAVMYDPWQDFSLYDGLTGYGRYLLSRLRRQPSFVQAEGCLMYIIRQIEEKLSDIPTEELTEVYCFLHDLHEMPGMDVSPDLLEQCRKLSVDSGQFLPRLGDSTIGNIVRMYQRCRHFNDIPQGEIELSLKQIPDLDRERPPVSMGLLTGYAGEGMLRLAALDPTNVSWMELL